MATLEVCIDSVAGLDACTDEAPDRVELCSALELGGLTPSSGLMKLAGRTSLATFAMIRPRAGNFMFDANEVSVMCDDIAAAMNAGVSGVVLGVAEASSAVNTTPVLNLRALETLVKAAGPLTKTLHRVIDTLEEPLVGMEQAIELGFDHILTSGGEPKVASGLSLLTELQRQSAGRITIMAGAGLTPSLVQVIHQQTGVSAFHSSCSKLAQEVKNVDTLGFSNARLRITDAHMIWQYKQELKRISALTL